MDFPRMIYHPVFDCKIVHNEADLQSHLLVGWSKKRIDFSEKEAIRAAIKEQEAKLEALYEKLDTIESAETEATLTVTGPPGGMIVDMPEDKPPESVILASVFDVSPIAEPPESDDDKSIPNGEDEYVLSEEESTAEADVFVPVKRGPGRPRKS